MASCVTSSASSRLRKSQRARLKAASRCGSTHSSNRFLSSCSTTPKPTSVVSVSYNYRGLDFIPFRGQVQRKEGQQARVRSLRDDIFSRPGAPGNKTAKPLVSIARTRPRVARVCFSFSSLRHRRWDVPGRVARRKNVARGKDKIVMNHNHDGIDRRGFLKCMAWAGTGTLCVMKGGVLNSYVLSAFTTAARAK